jgi:hypothetical protein
MATLSDAHTSLSLSAQIFGHGLADIVAHTLHAIDEDIVHRHGKRIRQCFRRCSDESLVLFTIA